MNKPSSRLQHIEYIIVLTYNKNQKQLYRIAVIIFYSKIRRCGMIANDSIIQISTRVHRI